MLDWGHARSRAGHRQVLDIIRAVGPNTLAYVLPGLAVAAVADVLTGVWNAIRPRSLVARLAAGGAIALSAIPSYWLGYLLAMQAVQRLKLLWSTSRTPPRRTSRICCWLR